MLTLRTNSDFSRGAAARRVEGRAAARSRHLLWLLALSVALAGCASRRTVTFVSQEQGSELSLVPIDSPSSEGRRLRNPTRLELGTLSSQAVRISATGKASQFWFFPASEGNAIQVNVERLPICGSQENNPNRPVRLLLKGYQALYARDYRLAREMASQASVMDATLAAPHIISGLAYLREGDKARARTSFKKAAALDPEDQEISVLLRATQ